jgi:hypothetical protein
MGETTPQAYCSGRFSIEAGEPRHLRTSLGRIVRMYEEKPLQFLLWTTQAVPAGHIPELSVYRRMLIHQNPSTHFSILEADQQPIETVFQTAHRPYP